MRVYDQLLSVVLGISAASSMGCSLLFGPCEPEPIRGFESYALPTLTDNEPLDDEVRGRLEAFARTNPNATASQKLIHLYSADTSTSSSDAPLTQTNLTVRMLVLEAMRDAMGSGLEPELCERMCLAQGPEMSGVAIRDLLCSGPEANQPFTTLNCEVNFEYGLSSEHCTAGRRALGTQDQRERLTARDARGLWWSQIHCLEKEAVYAFIQLAGELEALGAPASLVTRCLEAAAEEVEHAQQTGALAIQFGGSLAPVPPATTSSTRTLFELALHNVSEGCVRESFAGIEAIWQAERAEPATRPTLRQIAREECGHAALSWDIHTWACSLLTQDEVLALEAARQDAIATLQADLQARAARPWPPELGLPDAPTSLALLQGMNQALSPLASATLT